MDLADISKCYHSLLARDKMLFSDVLVASIILIISLEMLYIPF